MFDALLAEILTAPLEEYKDAAETMTFFKQQ